VSRRLRHKGGPISTARKKSNYVTVVLIKQHFSNSPVSRRRNLGKRGTAVPPRPGNGLSLVSGSLLRAKRSFDLLFVGVHECVELDRHLAAQRLPAMRRRTVGVDHVAIWKRE
jgi:hypothetical protein